MKNVIKKIEFQKSLLVSTDICNGQSLDLEFIHFFRK